MKGHRMALFPKPHANKLIEVAIPAGDSLRLIEVLVFVQRNGGPQAQFRTGFIRDGWVYLRWRVAPVCYARRMLAAAKYLHLPCCKVDQQFADKTEPALKLAPRAKAAPAATAPATTPADPAGQVQVPFADPTLPDESGRTKTSPYTGAKYRRPRRFKKHPRLQNRPAPAAPVVVETPAPIAPFVVLSEIRVEGTP